MNLSRVFLYSSVLTFVANYAVAKYCVKLPTCEELGYIYSADKYPNNRSVKCPFDTKKILLLDYCQAYGLTSCDSTSGECDECIVEKADGTKSNSGYWRYTRCNAGYSYKSGECPPTEVDREQYPLEGSENLDESIGEIECVQSAQNIYCGYKSCNEGWNLNSGNCIVHDCGSAYPYTSCDPNGTCEVCKSGTNAKYSTPICNNGWYASGSTCVENACTGFTSVSSTIDNCTTTSSCQKGATAVYKCDACATDYELVNGSCIQSCALTSTTKPSNCTTATETCTKDGTIYYSTTCATCKDGYYVNSSNTCSKNACTGYGSSKTGCKTYDTCKSGSTTKYKCTTCNNGYTISSGQCGADACYGFGSSNSYCSAYTTCLSGTTTKYKCTACSDSMYVVNSSNQCVHTCQNQGYVNVDYSLACQVGGPTSICPGSYSICPDDSAWQKCDSTVLMPCIPEIM